MRWNGFQPKKKERWLQVLVKTEDESRDDSQATGSRARWNMQKTDYSTWEAEERKGGELEDESIQSRHRR